MKLHIIEAILDPENSRSVKLLEKNNFVYDRLEEKAAVYVLKNPLPK